MGPVGLGHCLLATTPESVGEQQPIGDEESGCWLVADARLDNRDDLVAALEQARLPLRWGTDAELILRAYQLWGEAAPEKLLGDFAFALWDERRQRLFAARDPLGVKPFYYHLDNRRFLFASALKALFASTSLRRRPNELMIGLYLADDFSEKEQTLYADVFRLPGAHRMTLAGGQRKGDRYWRPAWDKPIRYARDEDYAEHFREIFACAVECRLRSPQPVGAFLSGGLDSGSVVSMTQHLYEKNGQSKALEAFSGYFLDPPCDEREYTEEHTRRWPIRVNYYLLDGIGAATYAEEMTEQFEGIHEATLFTYWVLAEKAREKGIRVILTGTGGDDFYSGNPYVFSDLLRRGRLQDVYVQINQLAQTLSLDRRGLWLYYTLLPLLPDPIRGLLRRLRWQFRGRYPRWIAPDFAQRIHLTEHLGADRRGLPKIEQARRYTYQTLNADCWTFTMEELNALAAAKQIEFRCPFADPRLVDFALRIPGGQFLRGDFTKWTLRLALKGILPEPIRLRKKKTRFDEVVEKELRESDLAGTLDRLELVTEGFVDAEELKRFYAQVCCGGTGHTVLFYTILSLNTWYKMWCRDQNPSLTQGSGGMDD